MGYPIDEDAELRRIEALSPEELRAELAELGIIDADIESGKRRLLETIEAAQSGRE